MDYFNAMARNNPDYHTQLLLEGWTARSFNNLAPYERAELYEKYKHGERLNDSILSQFPGAVVETVKEQGRVVGGVVKAVNRSVTRTLVIVAVIAVAGAVVVYRDELKETAEAVRKAIK